MVLKHQSICQVSLRTYRRRGARSDDPSPVTSRVRHSSYFLRPARKPFTVKLMLLKLQGTSLVRAPSKAMWGASNMSIRSYVFIGFYAFYERYPVAY